MKLKILSAALALCLCASSMPAVHAGQEAPAGEPVTLQLTSEEGAIPTPTQVYEAMIALKDQDAYKEGTPWTDYEPYSDSEGYYYWNGGLIEGKRIAAVGCVAFAFILSDAAFGSLPNRMYAQGGFKYEDIKVGDILRVSNDTHTAIVLEVNDAGVVVAEGNISTGDHKGKVHWGRTISKEEVMGNTSHYITRYPEGYVPPDDPTANEIIESGTLDTGLSWELTKAGTLTISGSGSMPDFSAVSDQPWNTYGSQIRTVIIEEGITSIGACAFWQCGVLSVSIPSSVTAIGNYAFRESSIISVDIPAGVKIIGNDAFNKCVNLSSVTVSEGLESIGERAFQSCTSLKSIALPASIGEVGAAAFFQCTAMTSATFAPGSKQVKLGNNLFTECWYLMGVTLPQSIDRIGDGMFMNCKIFPGVEIPQGAESIGDSAFASSGVSVVVIPASVTSIGIAAFSSTPLTDIYFTGTEAQWKSISKIGDTAAALAKATIHYNYVPTATPTPTPEATATPTPTPEATATPTPTPEATATPTPKPTPTLTPTPTKKPVQTTEPTQEPVQTTEPIQTTEPTQEPVQTVEPTQEPVQTVEPTQEPAQTEKPTEEPAQTAEPTQEPVQTAEPTAKPEPTEEPVRTMAPTAEPTEIPPVEESPAPLPEEDLTYEDGNYYFYENGEKAISKEAYVDGAWRWFEEDGTMVTNKDVYQTSNGGKWVRYDEDGEMVKGEDYRNGGWYYFDSVTGAMAKGPVTLEDGRQVYYDTVTGQMLKGEQNINGQIYYFDGTDGHLISGENTKVWVQIDGKDYWYEDWQRQGCESADASYRGKEIYDPVSDAWYWLDSIQQGAKAVSKDVYQESYSAYPDREDGTGKWVRYDENGRMVKGWDTTEAGTYYFEEVTGAMAKGHVVIEGRAYYFDPVTGIRQN